MISNYNKEIYKMYEEELSKNDKLSKEIKRLRLDNSVIIGDYNRLKDNFNKKVIEQTEKETIPLIDENKRLQNDLDKAYEEIKRLKDEISKKEYNIAKLECSANKDSTNSGIPTSKEIGHKKHNNSVNTYNHREKSTKRPGGQVGHKGTTLTKEKLQKKMKENNIEPKKVIHYIRGNKHQKDTIKYTIGLKVQLYVEEHIFKHTPKSSEVLPKEYYSEVTYNDDLKSLVVALGNYYSLGYSKINEILSDFSNGIINISQGTIDNIYEEFADKSEETINNIATNLLNGKYQHTDEVTTKQNGKDTYYRGYANPYNVLYKYHAHKGDSPIEEDDILTNFFGIIISDHEVGIFKYGANNQDCVIHLGRYCIEGVQNVIETEWQMELYRFLLKIERQRKILLKFGRACFSKEEIEAIEDEYDIILQFGETQNELISSTYWKEKENALLRRLKKYKNKTLFFIHDFDVPYDNNFMERLLRMIKGKTKISGGFRSTNGGERFGKVMSIIKTAKLRKLNPLTCIKSIYEGKALFA